MYMGDDFDQPTEVLLGSVRVSHKGFLVPLTKRGTPMDPAYISGGRYLAIDFDPLTPAEEKKKMKEEKALEHEARMEEQAKLKAKKKKEKALKHAELLDEHQRAKNVKENEDCEPCPYLYPDYDTD